MSRYTWKTDHGITDFKKVVAAIKGVKIEKKVVRAVAKSFRIPKSSLARYVQKFDTEVNDISTIDSFAFSSNSSDSSTLEDSELIEFYRMQHVQATCAFEMR